MCLVGLGGCREALEGATWQLTQMLAEQVRGGSRGHLETARRNTAWGAFLFRVDFTELVTHGFRFSPQSLPEGRRKHGHSLHTQEGPD